LLKTLTFILVVIIFVVAMANAPSKKSARLDSNEPSAEEILKLLNNCKKVGGDYNMEKYVPAAIPICKLKGAYYWKADMSVDCDGIASDQCNVNTDSDYQNHTTLTTSTGEPLNAATLPYAVIPQPSGRWDYRVNNIKLGAVVVVIYNGQVRYGVFGDTGGPDIIGEASYAMVKSFGLNPNPNINAVPTIAVTYIVFPGSHVSPVESHEAAMVLGVRLLSKLIRDNTPE